MENSVAIRAWKPEDAAALAGICNNRNIWINLRDHFPQPYTVTDAIEWIAHTHTQKPLQNFAVTFNGGVAGSVGVVPKYDVYRKSIEIGYFIGEQFWGKGIGTEAVALVIDYIRHTFDVLRVYAEIFAHNQASMKVLQKNGFHLEGIRRRSVIKNNVIMDDHVWVRFLDEPAIPSV